MDLSIEAYAGLMAALASAGEGRGAVLAHHGLDERRWEVIDTAWQDKLSEALDPDDDGVPPLLAAYVAAYEAAQGALAPPISLEQLARVTRLLQASGDVRASLAKVGVSLADYVRGTEHWSRKLVGEPELERRFHEVLRDG